MNGPPEGDDSKNMMVLPWDVLIELEVVLAFKIFLVVRRYRNCGLLHLDLLSHLIRLTHACVYSDHSLDEDYQFNYKLESELLGSNYRQRRFLNKLVLQLCHSSLNPSHDLIKLL